MRLTRRHSFSLRTFAIILAFTFFFHPNFAADASIQQALQQLSADDQADRDAAEVALVQIGKPAIEPLRALLEDPRPEVRMRARRALRQIRLFLLPAVSDEALLLAHRYLSATDAEHRKPWLNQLFRIQPQPNAVLTRLIPLETDEDLRRQILYQLATGYRQALPRMITEDDDLPGVLSILDGAAEMWGRGEAADDAMVRFLTGQIDQQIAICEAEQINGDVPAQERAAQQLCYLYRVEGKYDQALKYARLSRDPSLVFLVLQDQGDWSAAAKEPDARWREPVVAAAYRACFQRLSGHPQAAADIMQAMATSAVDDADPPYSSSRLFLLNDQPERGIELLMNQHPDVAFEMRLARGEISQAIEIANKFDTHPQTRLAALHENLRQTLGELPQPTTQSTAVESDKSDKAWEAAVNALNDKKYPLAAELFGQLWKDDRTHLDLWTTDHTHFDRLYLQGYALDQAGQNDRGKELMHQAELLPLGDPMARWQLAAGLQSAGLDDAAEHQRDLGLRAGGDFDELGFSEICNTRAQNAIEHKQWHAAADALDHLCLINLSAQVQWRDSTRLLTIPALTHLVKARDAREHHDLTTTMNELNLYQQYLPASSDMVLEMVPALDEIGEHAKADEVFNGVYEKLVAICAKYPKSITYENQLAWMSACCERRLDEALAAAQTAARLQPQNWQVLDTLAEVRFRRGDRAAAVDLEKRAMSMSADAYITRQLKRFEGAAIPSTTQPGVAPE